MKNLIFTGAAAGSAALLAFGATLYFTQSKATPAAAATPIVAAPVAPPVATPLEPKPPEPKPAEGSAYDRIPSQGVTFADDLTDRDEIKLSIFNARDQTKQRVLDHLTDPYSAQFKRVAATRFEQGSSVVLFCGHVNSKNGFGGYGQPMRFYGINKSTIVDDGGEAFQRGWARSCENAEMVAVIENF